MSYKILSNIILSVLTPYVDEIIGKCQDGFRRNISITDHIVCILQIWEKMGVELDNKTTSYRLQECYKSVRMKYSYWV
jgi:hypothetical protein